MDGATQNSPTITDFSEVNCAPLDMDDLFDVKNELNPVSAKWRSIGIALRLNPNTLECIQIKSIGDPSTCLTSMLTEWLHRNYNMEKFGEPTWKRLVEAVGDPAGGENMALAKDMAKRHKAGAATTHELTKAVVFAHENRQAITAKFAAFQTKVCNKLFKNGVNTNEFRLYVMNQFPPGDCIPRSPTSLTEVFDAITHHGLWDCFHYSPLVRIVQTFGASDPEMEGWVQTYKQDVKAYQLVTTVEEYIEADLDVADTPPAERAKCDPRYYTPVEWKTKFIDHSLQYLTEVWEFFSSRYLVPDSPPTALLDRLRRGCFAVTWLVPSGLIPQLIKQAKIDTEFFHQYHILKVTVGDKCIYEEVPEESTSKARLTQSKKIPPHSFIHSVKIMSTSTNKTLEERCVVVLGKSGAGKSTVANQLAKHDPMSSDDPPFVISNQVLQSITHDVSEIVKLFSQGDVEYKVTVIDTVGLFDTKPLRHHHLFNKIEEYFKKNIKGVNVILFVFRKGRMTKEQKEVFSFIESRLYKELSPISALAITGCENMDDKAREALLDEFKGDQETKQIADQMGKGIYPVGFPSIETMLPELREVYKPQMAKDRDTLLDLVFRAKKVHLTEELFLEKVKPVAQEAYDAVSSSGWPCNLL